MSKPNIDKFLSGCAAAAVDKPAPDAVAAGKRMGKKKKKSPQEKCDELAALHEDLNAYSAAGRIVVGWFFNKSVKTIQTSKVGSSGKRELPDSNWRPIHECNGNLLQQEANLKNECMRLLASQTSRTEHATKRGLRKKQRRPMDLGIESRFAIDLAARILSCPPETAETIITVYYMPAIKQLIREPKIWKAIEQIADALMHAPIGYLEANEVNELLKRIDTENREKNLGNSAMVTVGDAR